VFSVSPILGAADRQPDHREFRLARRVLTVTGAAALPPSCSRPRSRRRGRRNERVGSSFGTALAGYRFLMGDRKFLGLVAIAASALRVSSSICRVRPSS